MKTDHSLLAAFVAAGITDVRLAKHYGVSPTRVMRWRKALGLERTEASYRRGQRSAPAEHGTIIAYNAGCRCADCRTANRMHYRSSRVSRMQRTKDNGGVAPVANHNSSTAINWGCQCDKCRDALREANRRSYEAWATRRDERRASAS